MISKYYSSISRLIFIISLLIFSGQLFSQALPFGSEPIKERRILRGEVQDIQVENTRGTFQWQQSSDGISWQNIVGKTASSMSVIADVIVYVRCAIKEGSCDQGYSDILKISPFEPATVTTAPISAITLISAVSGGNVVSAGGLALTERGVCWSTNFEPTIDDHRTTDGNETGEFTSRITGLTGGTNYYVRAYATNATGTSYGAEIKFSTATALATVTTTPITAITQTTARGGGNVLADGGLPVLSRGICWSTSPNPTTQNFKTIDGASTGAFTSILSSLTSNTTYYVRAYAINSSGTSYGNQVSFKTAL
jgi:hypothetical protein